MESPTREVHVPPGWERGLRDRCRALSLALPTDAMFTSTTAALLRGWWLPAMLEAAPVVACTNAAEPHHNRRGVYIRRCATRPDERSEIEGVTIATVARTFLELAELLSLVDLVVAMDCALHRGECTINDLRAAVVPRRRGVRTMRRAIELADGRSESPWESILRLVHVLSGIPVAPQHEIREAGRVIARGDLRVGATRRLHEYDGADHRDRERHHHDLRREKALGRLGWTRYGYVAPEIRTHPQQIIKDAERALGLAHVPDRVKDWLQESAVSSLSPGGRAILTTRISRFVRTESPRRKLSPSGAVWPDS